MKWATARRPQILERFRVRSVARIRGLENLLRFEPGAYAPGFMLPPASQAALMG